MNSKPQEKIILDVGAWEQKFQELMQEVKPRHRWTLKLDETLQPDCVAQGGKQYQQKAFGRFRCSSCRRNWASAQVQVLCHMYLEPRESQGHVFMRLFAQRCQKCSGAQFEKPEFSIESAMRILNNLVYRIWERCYGNGIRKFSEIPVIPELPLEGSHDMSNCEACNLGFCVMSLQNCMTKPSNSPFSYMEIGSFDDICSQTQAMNQSAKAKEAQRSGDSCEHKRSGPSHATARTHMPGTGPQLKWEAGRQPTPGSDQQAARRTGSQPIQVSRSLPSGWTALQPTRAVGSLSSQGANSQSALRTGPQTPQKTYSQAVRQVNQQSKQETVSQATQGAGLQAPKKTDLQPTRRVSPTATHGSDLQPTRRVSPTATHGSGTFNGTQGVYRRQESYLPRGYAPDSFSRSSTMPPNDSRGPNNLFRWGYDCVADLWNFVASKLF
ncbi:receptor-transporting protein 4 [Eptesicus fuscus]|uniref:receptor-transporting protein 4 n=1 Tax=Eptesicus fuscus TaxID=29078 RepID=UPI002404183D|nr:receptor-transporting protein 4 [Eptesicus fuscus]